MLILVIVLAVVCVLLLAALAVMCLAYYGCVMHLREVEALARNLTADLDALSIAGPRVDPDGGHDRLPIRDDIRQVLTDYCEGIWNTPNGDTK